MRMRVFTAERRAHNFTKAALSPKLIKMSALCQTDLELSTELLKLSSAFNMKDGGEEREGDGGDGEGRLEDDDDLLAQSMEADEVGKMLRSTLSDLEMALEESRKLLAERDEELVHLKSELESYKMQVAKEIANKTKIAKSLDESLSHVREMEEITQQWQLEVRESRQLSEKQQIQLTREKGRNKDLELKIEELTEDKEATIAHLTSQLMEMKKKIAATGGDGGANDTEGLDDMTFHFLRQAVFHFLTDIHPEDHLRSISSILKFTPQERKAVYSKYADHKK